MKVYDVLTESKQVDEGPVRFLKRTLGKNTAMGKAAQLDVELDKEVSSIYKDFVAVSKQDPKKGGMTAKGLANFLKAKGFVSDPMAVIRYLKKDSGLGRKAAKAGKNIVKKTKSGAGMVQQAASNLKKDLKKKLSPEPTGLTPDQPNLPGIESMYSEARLMELDLKLSSGEAKKIIKRFVQQGFQKQMGNRLSKSSYGDAPTGDNKSSSSKTMMPNDEVKNAIEVLRANGFTVDTEKKTVTT